ncbi:hypothetical protein [Microbacterium sp. Leaf320]|uniref:hypothetical protein n=1 Tax=Microbacterium sp. Leaf320 TaxID=1736334 RepID=UPI0007015E6D|nr:hypothetical protein [Microbacterium sp. Leaf320]KQQ68446.1 hypothetical protein ASF63_00025 [Microbacterium sp. Leaf320]
MTHDPLRTTLDTLRSEREDAERRASELDEELQTVGRRLTHLRGAIENIEALLGVPSVEDEAVLADAAGGENDTATNATNSRWINITHVDEGGEPVVRKRVPSTEWVSEVVEKMGHPADRDEIYKAFNHYKGFPRTWTNPRNSVNNALVRAVERGLVQKLDENLFAPLGYEPRASNTSGREDS